MKFRPHGNASCRLEDQLIVLELEGPWNSELVIQIQKDISALKSHLSGHRKWGMLILVSNSILCPLNTFETISCGVQEDAVHAGHAAVGFVAPLSVEGRSLVESIYCKIYEGICPVAFFETIDDARLWMAQYLVN